MIVDNAGSCDAITRDSLTVVENITRRRRNAIAREATGRRDDTSKGNAYIRGTGNLYLALLSLAATFLFFAKKPRDFSPARASRNIQFRNLIQN